MRIAISGWSLTQTHFRPQSLHLLDLFAVWRSAGDELILIRPPDVSVDLPGYVHSLRLRTGRGRWSRLISEGWVVPRQAAEAGAEALFIPEPMSPLVSPVPVVAVLTARDLRPTSFPERIQRAIGRAGLAGAAGLLRSDDLPPCARALPSLRTMPAFVGPGFTPGPAKIDGDHLRGLGLASGYCLAFGGSEDELRILLAAWSWVSGSLGADYPLVIVGGGESSADTVHTLAVAARVEESIRWIERISFESLAPLYRGANAFLHAGPTPTGQELRWALACGVPIASAETPVTVAVVGDAGYLVSPFDTRALGAACLTLIVESDVAEKLKRRGLMRASSYHEPSTWQAWADVFRSILQTGRSRP